MTDAWDHDLGDGLRTARLRREHADEHLAAAGRRVRDRLQPQDLRAAVAMPDQGSHEDRCISPAPGARTARRGRKWSGNSA